MRTFTALLTATLFWGSPVNLHAGEFPVPVEAAIQAATPYQELKTSFSIRIKVPDAYTVEF